MKNIGRRSCLRGGRLRILAKKIPVVFWKVCPPSDFAVSVDVSLTIPFLLLHRTDLGL